MKNDVKTRLVLDEIFSQNREKLNQAGVTVMFSEELEDCIVIRVYEAQKDVACCFDSMEILKREIPMIRKIVQDECWLMGERMNRPVEPKEVEKVVASIVMKVGEKMRVEAVKELKSEKCIRNCDQCQWRPKK